MLMQLWAKLSAGEKFIGYGVLAVVVGWIAGLILGTSSVCVNAGFGNICAGSINYFNWGNAGLFGLLALVLAILVGVVLYLKVAPNTNINWPMPVGQILLGGAVATLVCSALMTLIQFTNGGNPPALMYIADVLMVGGGAVMSWFAYQAYSAKV